VCCWVSVIEIKDCGGCDCLNTVPEHITKCKWHAPEALRLSFVFLRRTNDRTLSPSLSAVAGREGRERIWHIWSYEGADSEMQQWEGVMEQFHVVSVGIDPLAFIAHRLLKWGVEWSDGCTFSKKTRRNLEIVYVLCEVWSLANGWA